MREDNGSDVVVSIGLVCEMWAYKGFFMFAYFILMIVLEGDLTKKADGVVLVVLLPVEVEMGM